MGIFARQVHRDFAPRRATQVALRQAVVDQPRRRKIVIVDDARCQGPLIKELVAQGFDVVSAAPGSNDARALWKLFRLLRRERPDVTLFYGFKPMIYGALIAWLAGVDRRVAVVEGLGYGYTRGREWRRRVARVASDLFYRIACRLSGALLVQNQDDRDLFAKTFMRGREDRVHVASGVGVDLEAYAPEPLPRGPLTLVMIAPLLRDKGVYEFAEAARRLKEQQLDVRLLLVGALESGRRAVRSEDLEAWLRDGRLEHVGAVDDVRPWIKQSHVLVLPSYREGRPRVVMEAMAMGRPCIVTDVPGCRDVVAHHRNGMVVDAQSAAALVDAVTLILRKRKLLDPWSRAAVTAAKDNFDAARQAADMAAKLRAFC